LINNLYESDYIIYKTADLHELQYVVLSHLLMI